MAIWTAVFWASVFPVFAEKRTAFQSALESITAGELRAHVAYLADDALEGRLAGSEGARKAAEYVANFLAQRSLQPAGSDGSYYQPFDKEYRNVLALLPGTHLDLRWEVIVVGAHYDHIGLGQKGHIRGPAGQIYNGADDNASGVAGVLELVDAFGLLPDLCKRSVLFAFWDAEEIGALGSKHWMTHPTLPDHRVVFMLNLDMIGRLREEKLTLFGTRTGYGLRRLLSEQNQFSGLRLDFDWKLAANSDHYSFVEKKIPALLFHTGLHEDYHRPTDDLQRINVEGMERVVRLAFGTTWTLANSESVPVFRDESARETPDTFQAILVQRPVLPLRLGVVWSEKEFVGPGVRLVDVVPDSPAAKAGLRPGDHLLRINAQQIHSGPELLRWVMTTPRSVDLEVLRPGQEKLLTFHIHLSGEPMRLGFLWRTDDAEPGTAILTYVMPGSPAELAGLRPGDHVYQLGNHPWPTDETQLEKTLSQMTDTVLLKIERVGRIQSIPLRLLPASSADGPKPKRPTDHSFEKSSEKEKQKTARVSRPLGVKQHASARQSPRNSPQMLAC